MIAAASVLGLVLAGCDEKDNNDNPKVEINIKDYGTIKAELNPEQAPITVENFISLAEEGFYDGLTFHRIMDGFMMQGGDPLGNGTGGSEETIKGEFSQNGVNNTISHKKGTLSMARSQAPDSASSQFFIVDGVALQRPIGMDLNNPCLFLSFSTSFLLNITPRTTHKPLHLHQNINLLS